MLFNIYTLPFVERNPVLSSSNRAVHCLLKLCNLQIFIFNSYVYKISVDYRAYGHRPSDSIRSLVAANVQPLHPPLHHFRILQFLQAPFISLMEISRN